jgi:hypothetical protein
MLWEILGIFFLYGIIKVFDIDELALGQELHFLGPDDRDTHVLPSIGHDSTCEVVWVNCQ